LAALAIWTRGLRVVRWSRWNSSSSELAYAHGWGEAHMAIVDTTMVRRVAVLLPYVRSVDGWTLWEPVCGGHVGDRPSRHRSPNPWPNRPHDRM
jgi:hypothetical protein